MGKHSSSSKVKRGRLPVPSPSGARPKGGGNKCRKKISKKSTDEDWVASLAAKASAEGTTETASSKAAAIERRLEKKRRRNDRLVAKAKEKEARKMARETDHESRKRHQKRRDVPDSSSEDVVENEMEAIEAFRQQYNRRSGTPPRRTSSQCLSKLSAEVMHAAEGWNDHERRVRPYIDPSADPKRGKATKQRKYETSNIQPQKRDYGGLGLARPSLFLPLLDPSFIPKFEAEFEEHVVGFFGKQRTKAMKKQLDGDLLWRRLRAEKEKGGAATKGKRGSSEESWQDKKVDGKKLSDMSPDDRVEAMIKLGLI